MILRKQAQLEKLEGKLAYFTLENGQTFSVAKDEIGTAQVGDNYVIQIMNEQEALLERNALAEELLNQILQETK